MPVASVPRNSTRRPPSAVSLGTISRNWFGLDPVAVVFVPRSMLTCGCSNARPASSRPGIILPILYREKLTLTPWPALVASKYWMVAAAFALGLWLPVAVPGKRVVLPVEEGK